MTDRAIPREAIRVHDRAQGICWFGPIDGQGLSGERDCRPAPFSPVHRVRVTEYEPRRGRLTYEVIGVGLRWLRAIDEEPLLGSAATDPQRPTPEAS